MVYVIQEQQGKNILPAMKYGEISILLPPGMQVSFSSGQVVNQLNVKLSTFNDSDFLVLILVTGFIVAIGSYLFSKIQI